MTKDQQEAIREEREKTLAAIHKLTTTNKEQSNIISQLKIDLNSAQNKVRDLAEQLKVTHNINKNF